MDTLLLLVSNELARDTLQEALQRDFRLLDADAIESGLDYDACIVDELTFGKYSTQIKSYRESWLPRLIPVLAVIQPDAFETLAADPDSCADEFFTWPVPPGLISARLKRMLNSRQTMDDGFRRWLTRTEAALEDTFTLAAIGIAHVAPDGSWLRVNQCLCDIVGYTESELRAKTFQDITHPDDLNRDLDLLTAVIAGDIDTYSMEKRYFRKDGSIVWINLTVAVARNADGSPDHFISIVEDIDDRKRMEESLRASEARLQAFIRNAPVALAMFDTDMRYMAASKRWLTDYKLDTDVIGRSHYEIFPEVPERWKEVHRRGMQGEISEANLDTFPRLDGSVQWLHWTVHPWYKDDTTIGGIVIHTDDVSQQKNDEARLRQASEVFQNCSEGIVLVDGNGLITAVNPAFSRDTGYDEDEVIGHSLKLFDSGRHDADFRRDVMAVLEANDQWHGEIWSRRKNGEVYPLLLSIQAIRNGDGPVHSYLGLTMDISEIKDVQSRLDHLAHHDALTGLPNRTLFQELLDVALLRADRTSSECGLMFLDLDHFKDINDSLGHAVGDRLLVAASARIKAELRASDVVSRVGGDEFNILVEQVQEPAELAALAERIITAVRRPFEIEGRLISSGASIGISVYPVDGEDSEQLLKNADAALYKSKAEGRATYRFFARALAEEANQRQAISSMLRQSIGTDQLELHYQLQVDLSDERPIGVEALARWNSIGLGSISPARFIPIAEETGLVGELGAWALETACKQMRIWLDAGSPISYVAVNVSAAQLADNNIVALVRDTMQTYRLEPGQLELEITESYLLRNPELALSVLEELSDLGVSLAIDDFGTGYSSLQYIKRMPINRLKIAQNFVEDMLVDSNDAAIVRAVVALGQSLAAC